jgi:hypothetical protein
MPQAVGAFEVHPNVLQTTVTGLRRILFFEAKCAPFLPE